MKRLLMPFIVFALLSCDNKPIEDPDAFIISEIRENIRDVTYEWSWSSSGFRDIVASFKIVDSIFGGEATAYSLDNKTGRISDVFTYRNGKPDLDSTRRAWIITFSGSVATRVNIDWSGTLVQTKGQGTTTVETLFQIYGDGEFEVGQGNWPSYSNNIRPQVDVDTLFLSRDENNNDIFEGIRDDLRREARERMIARYFNSSVNIAPSVEDDEEIILKHSMSGYNRHEIILQPGVTYRMQLFTRILNNDGDRNAEYEITNGTLRIWFD